MVLGQRQCTTGPARPQNDQGSEGVMPAETQLDTQYGPIGLSDQERPDYFNLNPYVIAHRLNKEAYVHGSARLRLSSLVRGRLEPDELATGDVNHPNYCDSSRNAVRLTPRLNGFVESVMEAHERRRRLTVSPDDVLTVIVSQFAYMMRGSPVMQREIWRDPAVLQRPVKIELPPLPTGSVPTVAPSTSAAGAGGDRGATSFTPIVTQLQQFMRRELRDQSFLRWFDRIFTTTTETQQLIRMTLFLGRCKEYTPGEVIGGHIAGITASVTITGELRDWETLDELIKPIGESTFRPATKWCGWLAQVCGMFPGIYRRPQTHTHMIWWSQATSICGVTWDVKYITGWLGAFCAWQWTGRPIRSSRWLPFRGLWKKFGRIKRNKIPPAYATVDIMITRRRPPPSANATGPLIGSDASSCCSDTDEGGPADGDAVPGEMYAGVFGSRWYTTNDLGATRPRYPARPTEQSLILDEPIPEDGRRLPEVLPAQAMNVDDLNLTPWTNSAILPLMEVTSLGRVICANGTIDRCGRRLERTVTG
ncbi:hypothetical protein KEM52_001475 [Ascosphaera acerosa]|nr:hypothetical protein KEM52_001475 [Ascosphaera acerosa]